MVVLNLLDSTRAGFVFVLFFFLGQQMDQVKDLVINDCRVFTATVAFAAVGAVFLGLKALGFLRTLLEVYVFSGIPVILQRSLRLVQCKVYSL